MILLLPTMIALVGATHYWDPFTTCWLILLATFAGAVLDDWVFNRHH